MKSHNNISEKLHNDLQHLEMGISLLREELNKQAKDDPSKISNKTKEFISLVNTSMEYIAKDFIPEQVKHDEDKSSNNIRIANDKIRELELKLGEQVSMHDVCYFIKAIEEQIREALNSISVYAAIDVTISEYSITAKLRFLRNQKRDTYYARNQEEIEVIKEENEKHRENFLNTFEYVDDKNSNELKIIITDKNINTIKDALSNHNINMNIQTMDTDRFVDEFGAIDSITLTENVSNFNLSFERSVYNKEL